MHSQLRAVEFSCLLPLWMVQAQPTPEGRLGFESTKCRSGDGNGSGLGPCVVSQVPRRNEAELAGLLRSGTPGVGMPAFPVSTPDTSGFVRYLRILPLRRGSADEVAAKVSIDDGKTIERLVMNQTSADMQILSGGRINLLPKRGDRYRRVSSLAAWPTYNGVLDGSQSTSLEQKTKGMSRGLRLNLASVSNDLFCSTTSSIWQSPQGQTP